VSHPDPELLAGLALGEPVPTDVSEHVAGCAACQDEVAALGATAGSLRGPVPALVAPPPGLRSAVLAAAAADATSTAPGPLGLHVTSGPPAGVAGSPVSAAPVDELAARRASNARATSSTGSRRFGTAWLVGAAAAGLVVGGIGVSAVERTRNAEPPTVVVAQAGLDTLDTGTRLGVADLVEHDGTTDLALHTDPMTADDGYLEVWLINRDGERMVSIGVLEPGRTDQTFAVPAELVAQGYVIVDISREPFDADATHSGESLARGTLPV
jgi:hypothetical protein